MMKNIKIYLLALGLFGAQQSIAQLIPFDAAVRTGKLPNGFTYYIRHNEQPEKRVFLYLVNNVGSVLEDDDQQGLAHFMEHMNFNGTKNFPKNTLVDYLQKAGVRFGADLNAHTSFDETVYELPLPVDDPAMLDKGLAIMRDWAQEALLDPTEIDKERGIVLEEERLQKGARDRVSRQYYPVVLNGARYADRFPIGKDSILNNFKPETIRRFYQDWYRPDLQALIVVGDIDPAKAEKMILEKFANLKNPVNERARTVYTIPLVNKTAFIKITDKETPATEIELTYKHPQHAVKTEADYLWLMKQSLLNQLLGSRRYAEISRLGNPAFSNTSFGVNGLMGGLDAFTFSVTPKKGQTRAAFQEAYRILEKISRYGFSTTELDREKQSYLRNMEQSFKEMDKTPSLSFIKEYQEYFLHGDAAPGITWEYNFAKTHLPEITPADITALLKEYLDSADRTQLVSGQESEKAYLPDAAQLNGWIKEAVEMPLQPFKENSVTKPLLAQKPQGGKIVKKQFIAQLGLTKVTLSNGVQLLLKPTNFKNDEIRFTAFSAGGTSLYNDADFDNAANAAALISRFGLGDLNPVELSTLLSGKVVNTAASIGARTQNINGVASPADMETALQLIYLQFTHPRKDSTLFSAVIKNANDALNNRYTDPNNVFSDTISRVMGNYQFRSSPSTAERLNSIFLDKVYQIYKDRFADASGFTFTFVGNFDPEQLLPLLTQYLGALPATHRNEQARDLGIHIPEGIITKKVYKGTENKGLVRLVISGDFKYTQANNQLLNALGQILQIKLLQHLRESESEVYSPSVQSVFNKQPQNRFAFIITFGCAPKNADHLINMVEMEMANLRNDGPEADDVEKYKAAYQKTTELALKDNGFWLAYISGQYENNEDPLQVLHNKEVLDKVTPAALKKAADIFLSGKNMISFELLPENVN
jgi:zinc protease